MILDPLPLCVNLSHYGLIKVSGKDAETFLQGQLSCDIREVTPTHHQLGAYCNIKGRVIALLRIFLVEDHYYLQLPKVLLEKTYSELKKYGMFSKIKLEKVENDPASKNNIKKFGVYGENSPEFLSELFDKEIKYEDGKTEQIGSILILCLPGLKPRFEIINFSSLTSIPSLPSLSSNIQDWTLLDIQAGIPEIWAESSEQFLPHDLNLPELNAVSFSKGCYRGQEIIARMEYRGNLKKRMIRMQIQDLQNIPTPGSLYEKEGKEVGRIVMGSFDKNNLEILIIQ